MSAATAEVMAIGELNFEGNVVPHSWYKSLIRENGKPYLAAITLLSEIVYWYRPTIIRDEATGHVVEYRRKFKADKLQRSYDSLAEQFGLSKRQVTDAMHWLTDKNLIDLDFRVIHTETGLILSNVLFIGINPSAVQVVTYKRDTYTEKTGEVSRKNVTGGTQKEDTYTDTTTETTTEKDTSGLFPESDEPQEPRQPRTSEEIRADTTAAFVRSLQRSGGDAGHWARDIPVLNGVDGASIRAVGELLHEHFHLDPLWADKRRVRQWQLECADLYTAASGNLKLILRVGQEMREAGLTVSAPRSLFSNVVAALALEESDDAGTGFSSDRMPHL